MATLASAALKDKPPEGVTLAGTNWWLDPYRSDDPQIAIQRAQQEQESRRSRDRGRASRGVFGDDWGRETDGRTWGGGSPDNSNPHDPFPDGGGGTVRKGSGGNSTTIDPTGGTQSATVSVGSLGGVGNPFVLQLTKNPDKLSFLQAKETLTVSGDQIDTECAPGNKIPISDSYGDGERACGWEGRAWVVETTRGKQFKRVDRYELAKDGKTLRYTTTATGQRMPEVRISRTYTVAPATG
jgi:hypothetical protein